MTDQYIPGLGSYAIRDRLAGADVAETDKILAAVAGMGYRTMELRPDDYALEPKEMKKVMDAHGLGICAMHAEMTELDERYDDVIRRFRTMGCSEVVIPSRPKSETDIPRFIDKVANYARRVQPDGMQLQYHNHVAEFVRLDDATTMMTRLLDMAKNGLFAIEVDTGWVQVAGLDPARFITSLPVEIGVVHLRDVTAAADFSNRAETVRVGAGYLNWPAIIAACKIRGVRHFVAEHNARDDSMALAAAAAEKILSVL